MTSAPKSEVSFDFTGKTVWITGASRGLGREITLGFARAGASLALTARTEAALADTAAEARALGAEVLELPASVSDSSAVSAAADAIGAAWGRLDVLVNCAGISPTFKKTEFVTDDEWRSVVDVNVTGIFLCAREASRLMLDHESASVVNLSSITGLVGMERMAAYSASKGAVDSLTRTLALEWATRGVRVNSIAPGYFETSMTEGLRSHDKWREVLLTRTPFGRFGQPDEIVAAVMFLASNGSSYMTGSTLVVDGGWTAA